MRVNTEKDCMKRAIAKIGGIQLDGNGKQAAYLFGKMAVDAHADRQFNFVPGVGQVFKRAAGLDVDRVISYLFELEYLESDSLTEFEEKLRLIIGGALIYSAQKSDYDYEAMEAAYMATFEAPSNEELPHDFMTLTADEEDLYGDIISLLMGDSEELETAPLDIFDNETGTNTSAVLPPETALNTKAIARQARVIKLTNEIRFRLYSVSTNERLKVMLLVLETLENMEHRRKIDLSEEKRAVIDS